MDQNNNYTNQATETREPLPTFGAQPPVVQYQQIPNPYAPQAQAEVENAADSAFGKGLASVIMSSFPITSIIAIFLGAGGLSGAKRTNAIAAHYGIEAGGKNIAARILSTIGLISSIVMTSFWGLYFLLIMAMFESI